jgi:poly(A) polymerase
VTSEALARAICERLRRHSHQALLVGGCVRDLLMHRTPKDFDVATDATPEAILRLYPQAHLAGAQFGVVRVRDGDAQVEVATFRSDLGYSDGRRPDGVRFECSPQADALRRDFTINALFMDPETGEILDYAGGREDIRLGRIRAIGDPSARFQEDYLRLLRAVRFAARLNFEIESGTARSIREHASRIREVAAERVRDELDRILTEGGARPGFELLDELGLLEIVLPEVAAMKGVEQPPEFHPEGDVWIHTLLMLESLKHPSITLAWGVLLHDVGKPPTFRIADRIRFDGHVEAGVEIARNILTRLRFSSEECDRITALIDQHMKFKDAPRMKASTLKRFLRQPHFDEHLELHRADCMSSHGSLDNYDFVRERWNTLPSEELKPPRLITGDDLIAMGFDPGPQFRSILTAIEDAQLEGRIRTSEEARQLASELYAAGSGNSSSNTSGSRIA